VDARRTFLDGYWPYWREDTATQRFVDIKAAFDAGRASVTASAPQASAVRLGDLVEMNHFCPYRDDYRGTELKLISLRLGPDGEQWATVTEGDPRHRGYGVYDGETDGIRASWLSPVSRPNRS